MMHLVFRILDIDPGRLKAAEAAVISLIRNYGFDAEVYMVPEMLEHGRRGLSGVLPALEINGFIVSKGTPLTPDTLRSIFEKLCALSVKKDNQEVPAK